MNNKIEEILKELNCIVYKYDKDNNLIFMDAYFSSMIAKWDFKESEDFERL